jgi:cyclopropane-fatty-acyl-phospholipid synthase
MTLAARFVLKALDRFAIGHLTLQLPDGSTRVFGDRAAQPAADLQVNDWRFFRRVLLDGDMGFAEAYMEGLCDSSDLAGLIALLAENEKALGRMARPNLVHSLLLRLLHPTPAPAPDATSTPITIWATSSIACGSIPR